MRLLPGRSTFLILCLLGLLSGAWAAGTPAGTVLRNQASGSAGTQQYFSNEVDTTVVAMCAVSAGPNGTVAAPAFRVGVTPGGNAVIPYRVVNSGNAPHTLRVSWAADQSSAFVPAPAQVRVHRDTNGDGLLNPGEPAIDAVTLPADASADLLLDVQVPVSALGSLFMNLIASCPDGHSDGDNVVQVTVSAAASVQLEKRFSPTQVAPGMISTVTVLLRNTGGATSAPLTMEDLLDTPELRQLSVLPQSVRVPYGTVQYRAAGNWSSDPPAAVTGLRWTVPALEPGQSAALNFDVRADEAAAPGLRRNIATASGQDLPAPLRAEGVLTVLPAPRIHLGPLGNAAALPGGELSASDTQTRDAAVVGQRTCFAQTLLNDGNVADALTVSAAFTAGQGAAVTQQLDGLPLQQPVPLDPGQQLNFQVCVILTEAGPATLKVTARSAAGAADNSTVDQVLLAQRGAPTLIKTVSPDGTVPGGTPLTYTLSVTNPFDFPLTDVTITDVLDPLLTFMSASGEGRYEARDRAVVWRLARLPSRAALTLTVAARVSSAAPDDAVIPNRFTLTAAQLPNPAASPAVQTPVFTSSLLVVKRAAPQVVTVGDRLTYTVEIRNTSAAAALVGGTLTDTPAPGLQYVTGSSRMQAQPAADPDVQGTQLRWNLPALAPGQTLTLQYDMRALPGVSATLTNTAVAQMNGPAGSAVVSNVSVARATVQALTLAPSAEIVGYVFVDRNRDGTYQADVDTPVPQARVLLAGGRAALTDLQGRYHFTQVPAGPQALRLDPAGVYNLPLSTPQDHGLPGTRAVQALGLVSVDFPLAPVAGAVQLSRRTRLIQGDVTLDKVVTAVDADTYEVQLTLRSPRALSAVRLHDPLPDAATLVSGQPDAQFEFAGGTRTFTYTFHLGTPGTPPTTDPTLEWSLP